MGAGFVVVCLDGATASAFAGAQLATPVSLWHPKSTSVPKARTIHKRGALDRWRGSECYVSNNVAWPSTLLFPFPFLCTFPFPESPSN